MSLSNTNNKVIYSGNGATTVWSYTFPIPDASYLSVIYTDADGVETTVSSSNYSVTGIGTTTGGTVTYPTSGSPIASGTKLTILRTVPYTQPTVFTNQGGYFPEVTESRLDQIVMAIQQLYERSQRSFSAPVSDSASIGDLPTSTTRANGGAGSFLAFDGSGNPYAGALTPLASASTWITNNLFPAISAAAARLVLGAVSTTGNETVAGNKTFSGNTAVGGTLAVTGATALNGGGTATTKAFGDNTTAIASTAFVQAAIAPVMAQNYLSGLGLSTAGSSATFSVAAGQAADSGNAVLMALAASISKTTSAWAVGTGNGALDTGTIANNTWYHVYLIRRPDTGVVDVLISTSASAPTMPTNYTQKRRIGSIRTNGSAQWVKFQQQGDLFTWDVPVADVNGTDPGTSAVTRTLTVPTGVVVQAWFSNAESNTSNNRNVLWTALDQTDTAPSSTMFSLRVSSLSAGSFSGEFYVKTNTSGQVRYRTDVSGASDGTVVATKGWLDRRGRDA